MNITIKKAGQGILVSTGKFKYALDKVSGRVGADYNLITHAHIDHLPYNPRGKVYASKETLYLASIRGFKYKSIADSIRDIEAIDAGHIAGSKSFLIEGKILYTGDINLNDRLFLKGFKPPKADILIIEATYGQPSFKFGRFNKLLDRLLSIISRYILEGRNIILEAFPLGKLQLISSILKWIKNVYVTKEIHKYNLAYHRLGLPIEDKDIVDLESIQEPFILLSQFINNESTVLKRFNPIRIRLSGWVVRYRKGLGIPLSDHADYNDLINIVESVEPKKIYVAYGYSNRFSEALRRLGYDAEPVL